MIGIVVLVVFFLLMVAVVPIWPYSRRWNLVPAGFLGFAWVAALFVVLGGY